MSAFARGATSYAVPSPLPNRRLCPVCTESYILSPTGTQCGHCRAKATSAKAKAARYSKLQERNRLLEADIRGVLQHEFDWHELDGAAVDDAVCVVMQVLRQYGLVTRE
jgi:hypothetical protein